MLDVEASWPPGWGCCSPVEELGMAGPTMALASITIVKGTVTSTRWRARPADPAGPRADHPPGNGQPVRHRRPPQDSETGRNSRGTSTVPASRLTPTATELVTQPKAMLMARCQLGVGPVCRAGCAAGDARDLRGTGGRRPEAAEAIERRDVRCRRRQPARSRIDREAEAEARSCSAARRPPATNARSAQPAEPVIPKIQTGQRNRLFGLLRTLGIGSTRPTADALALIGGQLDPPRELEGHRRSCWPRRRT